MDNNSFEEIMLEFNRFLGSIHEIDTDITEDINKLLCVDELFILLRIARISVGCIICHLQKVMQDHTLRLWGQMLLII